MRKYERSSSGKGIRFPFTVCELLPVLLSESFELNSGSGDEMMVYNGTNNRLLAFQFAEIFGVLK